MATSSTREDLLWSIDSLQDAIAWCKDNGEDYTRQEQVLADYQTRLAALGNTTGAVYNVPDGKGEGTPLRLTDRPSAGNRARNQFGDFQVHFASAKQTAFIKSLMDRKDLSPLADSVIIDVARLREQVASQQVNKKAASAIIDRLLALPDLAPKAGFGTTPVVQRPASDKQVGLIGRLAAERDWDSTGGPESHAGTVREVLAGVPVESRDASAAIDYLFGCVKAVARTPAAALEAGIYRIPGGEFGGTLVRVYYGRQSGQMLAKKVVLADEATDTQPAVYQFEYMGKADRFVTADQRLSLEEAKVWGRMTGTCCVCTAHLDDPNSVEAGIGPVCAKKF